MSEAAHLATPFTLGANGQARTDIQGSAADTLTRAYNVCVCTQGTREDNPEFGIPDLTFTGVPVSVAELQTPIERWAETPVTVSEVEQAATAAQITVEA